MSAQQEAGRARRGIRGALPWLALALVAGASTPARAVPVLTPEAAQKLPGLVEGVALPPGTSFSSIDVVGSQATFVLTRGSPPTILGRLVLTPANGAVGALGTPRFHIGIQVVKDTPEIRAALEAAKARMVQRDPGRLYTGAASRPDQGGAPHSAPTPAPAPRYLPAQIRAAWLSRSIAAFALLSLASVWVLRRSARP